MNKDFLIEIINGNQGLLQDLRKNQYIQNELLGLLRSIESIIPEDIRENFYTNLKTLRLNFDDETMMEQEHAGAYSRKNNTIYMDGSMLSIAGKNISKGEIDFDEQMLMSLYHELLHMASTTRDEYSSVGGFQNIAKTDDGEFLYADVLKGMTEGFTEYLTLLSFDKDNIETSSTYGRQINLMNHLSMIVGLDTMKKAYFNNRAGMEDIERALREIDGEPSHVNLYLDIESDYNFGVGDESYDPQRLANIEQYLLQLSSGKAKILLEKNPAMTNEDISAFWQKMERTINFPEKLELMDEDPKKHKGIEQLRPMFIALKQETMESRRKIPIEEIREATNGLKIPDIDEEYNAIKSQTQELENDDLKKLRSCTMKEDKKDVEEQKTINIRDYKKIEDILDNDRLIKIYALLPTKEAKTEFLETVLSTYGDRLSEKFDDRLEDEFEPNDSEIKQGYLRENIKNSRSIEDVLRGRRREPLRQGVTERVNYLVTQLQEGNYISREDREFLARHLAERPTTIDDSPSSRRDEIRNIVDTYIKAKNTELRNDANRFADKQRLEAQIQHQKSILANQLAGIHVNSTPEDIARTKKIIQDLEELQKSEQNKYPNINSMMHTVEPAFDIGKNNAELEVLMDILERESANLVGKGIKLPETGIREDDDIEIPIDDEQQTDDADKKQNGQQKADDKKVYVVNAQASLEQRHDKEGTKDVTVIEPTLGSSIEDFSAAIMQLKQKAQHIITKFNNFVIDSNAYQSPQEIVEAYNRHVQEHRKGTKMLGSKQEKITPAEIQSVVAINPRALQIMSETSATKQLVQASEDEKDIGTQKE